MARLARLVIPGIPYHVTQRELPCQDTESRNSRVDSGNSFEAGFAASAPCWRHVGLPLPGWPDDGRPDLTL